MQNLLNLAKTPKQISAILVKMLPLTDVTLLRDQQSSPYSEVLLTLAFFRSNTEDFVAENPIYINPGNTNRFSYPSRGDCNLI